jgi:hypothetical protein
MDVMPENSKGERKYYSAEESKGEKPKKKSKKTIAMEERAFRKSKKEAKEKREALIVKPDGFREVEEKVLHVNEDDFFTFG